jgi:hypothetical protein
VAFDHLAMMVAFGSDFFPIVVAHTDGRTNGKLIFKVGLVSLPRSLPYRPGQPGETNYVKEATGEIL